MKQNLLEKYAKQLVDITIQKHKDKLLNREKMTKFINANLPNNINNKDYNEILHLYNKYLAKEGYEIKKDISKFDIIDYNSDKYQIYINNL